MFLLLNRLHRLKHHQRRLKVGSFGCLSWL